MTDFLAGPTPTLQLERPESTVLLVRINRPAAANAMNTQMGLDLMAMFETLQIRAGRVALHRADRRRRPRLLRRRRPQRTQHHDATRNGWRST